jgi:uncharacterized protein YabN with tetrapyrrole methylase and pyrophosphatase domain
MPPGSLTVVGTGIRLSQLSIEARGAIECADKLLFLVGDYVTAAWLTSVNPNAESLDTFYRPGKLRFASYTEMVERILSCVREGLNVCVALYGHPGVFAYPTHEAVRRARLEGYRAKMQPGISAEDCLFADLGIDPATDGCQSFEATDFLICQQRFNPWVPLILWQIGVTGDLRRTCEHNPKGLRILVDFLLQHYDSTHEVIVYQAAQYVACEPNIQRVALERVPDVALKAFSTLFVPAKGPAVPDREMVERLGITADYFGQEDK